MKKILMTLILCFAICLPAFAGKRVTNKVLTISNAPITDYVVSGTTVTSDSIYQSGNVGFSSLLVKVSGTISISYQVSKDNVNWYTPYTTDGTTLTSAGSIASSVSADRWIVITARLSPYIRYAFTSGGSSTISANVVWQDEN